MKPMPKIEPCEPQVPDRLLRANQVAERRRDDVLDRLLIKLDANSRGAELKRMSDADTTSSAVRERE